MKLKDFATLQVGEQFCVGEFCKAVADELLEQRKVLMDIVLAKKLGWTLSDTTYDLYDKWSKEHE